MLSVFRVGRPLASAFASAAVMPRRGVSKAALVYDDLRASIIDLALKPGTRLDKQEICGRLGISRQPLAEAVVTFQPHAERNTRYPIATGSVGRTDSQGRYSLRLIEPDRPGAAVGEHSVTISTSVGGSDAVPPAGKPLPPAWRDGSRTFRVPANGTSEANFEIKISEPAKKKRK